MKFVNLSFEHRQNAGDPSKKSLLHRLTPHLNGIQILTILTTFLIALPILIIPFSFLEFDASIWRHIIDTLLGELVINTLILAIGVLTGTLILGVGSAWLTAIYDFPGRNFLNWALILPLSVPTYVLSFIFIGLFDFSGPVQTFFRQYGAFDFIKFFKIRSTPGVITVMSLALYPYVYLMARSAFQSQGKRILEVCQSCGYSLKRGFFKAALPMARPWIVSGLMLVLMETLADFGAVSIFNYDTFTTAIYKVWFGFFSISAAAQLSFLLLIFVFSVIVIEQLMQSKMQFHGVEAAASPPLRIQLTGKKRWTVFGVLLTLFLISFALPFSQLAIWAILSLSTQLDQRTMGLLLRSLIFSSSAALIITLLGLLLAYFKRSRKDRAARWAIQLATMGYALPGTVLAVGSVIVVNAIDRQLISIVTALTPFRIHSVLNGTLVVVIFAYCTRFMTAGFNSINSAMHRITQNLDETAALLGVTGIQLIRKVHIPILKNGLYTAAILVFVDVMKEMPMTLMTRPFGWDTLAVKIFELTSEGEWELAALPSILLVLSGMIPLIILNKKSEHPR